MEGPITTQPTKKGSGSCCVVFYDVPLPAFLRVVVVQKKAANSFLASYRTWKTKASCEQNDPIAVAAYCSTARWDWSARFLCRPRDVVPRERPSDKRPKSRCTQHRFCTRTGYATKANGTSLRCGHRWYRPRSDGYADIGPARPSVCFPSCRRTTIAHRVPAFLPVVQAAGSFPAGAELDSFFNQSAMVLRDTVNTRATPRREARSWQAARIWALRSSDTVRGVGFWQNVRLHS